MQCRATAKSAWQRAWMIISVSQYERMNFRPRWNAENGRFRTHSIERALSQTVRYFVRSHKSDFSHCSHCVINSGSVTKLRYSSTTGTLTPHRGRDRGEKCELL